MATRRLSGIATSSSVPDNGGDHSGGGGGSAGVASDDVFSTYVYTGTGAAQDIENGVDLAGEGGLVWIKRRDRNGYHCLVDSERDLAVLSSDSPNFEYPAQAGKDVTSLNVDGFSIADDYNAQINNSSGSYVSWTFRQAPKFFDVVTYTGTGSTQTIPHNLGCEPGMIIVKAIDQSYNWTVFHTALGALAEQYQIILNSTQGAQQNFSVWDNTAPTSTEFTLGNDAAVNGSNVEFVAYVFAHDDSDESIIKCGSYTGNSGSDHPEIHLGFEPQWLLIKRATGMDADWHLYDTMRGIPTAYPANMPTLFPNKSDPDTDLNAIEVTPTGFRPTVATYKPINEAGAEYVYVAIRRPTKPASEYEPEELFAIDDSPPSVGLNTGFPTDMSFAKVKNATGDWYNSARLIQGKYLLLQSTAAEGSSANFNYDQMDGYWDASGSMSGYTGFGFRRVPGFFDVVAYAGTGVAGTEVPHNLGVAPEMMWVKRRDYDNGSSNWIVYHKDIPANRSLKLDTNAPIGQYDETFFNNTSPTDTHFTLGPNSEVNYEAKSGGSHVAYLFASVPGISKVGSYTGNNGDQDIDCGFTAGARFVLIKRTDSSGDWMLFDTERGITAGSSPMLKLNETEVQATGSFIKPHSKGFTVTSNLTGIGGAEYIYMSIA